MMGVWNTERLTGEDLPETLHRGTDGALNADTTGFGPGGDGHVRFALVENDQRILQATRNIKRLLQG